MYARYKKASPTAPTTSDFSDNKYLTLIKFLDGVRLTADLQEERGIRNGTYARLAETYLIVGEAYGRKADYVKALEYVNVVRKRAAYKAGEVKIRTTGCFMVVPRMMLPAQNQRWWLLPLCLPRMPPANCIHLV